MTSSGFPPSLVFHSLFLPVDLCTSPSFPFGSSTGGDESKWRTDQSFPQGHRYAEDRHTGRISLCLSGRRVPQLYLTNTVHTAAHSANHTLIEASHCLQYLHLLRCSLEYFQHWVKYVGIMTNKWWVKKSLEDLSIHFNIYGDEYKSFDRRLDNNISCLCIYSFKKLFNRQDNVQKVIITK